MSSRRPAQQAWRLRSRALTISGAYGVLAALWIFGSDLVLFALLGDSAAVERWSVAKGIAFVTVTSLLLLLVLWRIFAALEGAFDALKASERRLSSSRAQLSAVINSAMDAIINTDSQGTVIAINPAAERMFGMSARDVLGKSVTRLLPDGVGPSTPSFLITKGVRLNGDGFPVEASVSHVTGRQDAMFTIILRDISQRLAQEKALRDMNVTLEHKVAERTRELEETAVRAQAADRLKSAFLATMSHELRTPLNSIIGFTGIVLQGLAGPLNDEQARQLGMVRGSARHLLELINDVLDLSKIEAGELQVRFEAFDACVSLQKVADLVAPLAEKKQLALQTEIDPAVGTVIADRRRFEQIMLNLLNNAIKFTDQGRIELQASVQPDGHLVIAVSDTGIGIKEKDLKGLFQPFSQIDTGLAREHEGTGLGLAICWRLSELMGGQITAQSTWGEGSRFTLTLPNGSQQHSGEVV